MSDLTQVIGERLKFKGWSQAELARAMGVTPSYLNQMLKGRRAISARVYHQIAIVLEMPTLELGREAALTVANDQPGIKEVVLVPHPRRPGAVRPLGKADKEVLCEAGVKWPLRLTGPRWRELVARCEAERIAISVRLDFPIASGQPDL